MSPGKIKQRFRVAFLELFPLICEFLHLTIATSSGDREVDVIGIFRYRNTWPLCIDFLKTGKIDVKPLITHRYGFSQQEVEDAFETSARGGSAIKVMFNL